MVRNEKGGRAGRRGGGGEEKGERIKRRRGEQGEGGKKGEGMGGEDVGGGRKIALEKREKEFAKGKSVGKRGGWSRSRGGVLRSGLCNRGREVGRRRRNSKKESILVDVKGNISFPRNFPISGRGSGGKKLTAWDQGKGRRWNIWGGQTQFKRQKKSPDHELENCKITKKRIMGKGGGAKNKVICKTCLLIGWTGAHQNSYHLEYFLPPPRL